jgi:hypothetical protein
MGTRGSFPKGKAWPWRDSDHLTHVVLRSRMRERYLYFLSPLVPVWHSGQLYFYYIMIKMMMRELCDEILLEWRQERCIWCVATSHSFCSSLVARYASGEVGRSSVSHWSWWRLSKLSGGEQTHFYILLQSRLGFVMRFSFILSNLSLITFMSFTVLMCITNATH